jgi:hypothetical protein
MEIFSGNASQRLLLSPTRLYDPVTGRFLQNEPVLVIRLEIVDLKDAHRKFHPREQGNEEEGLAGAAVKK